MESVEVHHTTDGDIALGWEGRTIALRSDELARSSILSILIHSEAGEFGDVMSELINVPTGYLTAWLELVRDAPECPETRDTRDNSANIHRLLVQLKV